MSRTGAPAVRAVAIIAAYNEADIIGPAIAHLAAQGVSSYLLNDGSTDGTVAAARAFEGRGLIGIESLPPPAGSRAVTFTLSRILERKAALASDLDADWFINHDADEFRESPWPHLSLAEAIGLVDRLGFNAIDFEVFNFVPDGEDWRPGTDPGASFSRYVPAAEYDRVQIRCWKKTAGPLDLEATAGHEARFADRRVFPIRFPLRHYPLRSAAHAERKVFEERLPRFDPEERARGWHVQYDRFAAGGDAPAPDSGSAIVFDRDAAAAAAQVRNRLVEAARPGVGAVPARLLADQVASIEAAIAAEQQRMSGLEQALGEREREVAGLRTEREEAARRLEDALKRLAASDAHARKLRRELDRAGRDSADLVRRLNEVFASRSWKITRPLRAVWRLLGGS